jgi:hypothetical protein
VATIHLTTNQSCATRKGGSGSTGAARAALVARGHREPCRGRAGRAKPPRRQAVPGRRASRPRRATALDGRAGPPRVRAAGHGAARPCRRAAAENRAPARRLALGKRNRAGADVVMQAVRVEGERGWRRGDKGEIASTTRLALGRFGRR